MPRDTIFALSSGSGPAGVAIIRLSGPAAFDSATKLCGGLPRPRQMGLRRLRDPADASLIDEALVAVFPGPGSFTGEDVVELHVHGSVAVIRHIAAVLGEMPGLRGADPGEFTYRAFEAGKLDLVEVEALGDLLAAETRVQARLAQIHQQHLHRAAEDWRRQMLELLALTEAGIDFSDEADVVTQLDSQVERDIAALMAQMRAAAATFSHAERMRRGFRVAVMGPPNAGKSTLVNTLAARDIAITSPIPGTTRDSIEVHLDLGGLPVTLIDTAGLRETLDSIEQMGIARAEVAAASADLVLWLSPDDMPAGDYSAPVISIRSRSDEMSHQSRVEHAGLAISCHTGAGLQDLIGLIRKRAESALMNCQSDMIVAHERQRRAVLDAADALDAALSCPEAMPELRAEEIRRAVRAVERLVGRIDCEEILDAIFSRFCIGK
ncbi:tRNA uridine-5-carboxymethylaminomethyl(34) synthesis GTPase MnmE [Rhabdaerophilum calidifontis]|uniref:tRNA uridine-5-carboxymethylaminomethyl(34) synthesis GTPase MnmE n=1 Tax=Rhabdaerophilum calidifontis TaxID=2604328 RepID=UPI00123B4C4C|nr:tRNA uridine-5-carboxymethylaminomethyl(34) synthesis GTPase MnmE [Rhabdaerophilum calidifontis]